MSVGDLIEEYKSFNVDKIKISKWIKNKEKYIAQGADAKKKPLFKMRPALKYKELFVELKKVFVSLRSKGHRIDFNWLCNI